MPRMGKRDDILQAAERAFDRHGFHGTGMDRLVEEAGCSTRTLYKHAGSKTDLACAILEERGARFLAGLREPGIEGLFSDLRRWIEREGARGCLFLRAHGEYGDGEPAVSAVVRRHKERFAEEIGRRVAEELGHPDEALAMQILVLFEGATAAAVYRGPAAVTSAAEAARQLVAAAGGASR